MSHFKVLMEVREFLLSLAQSEGETNLQGHVFSPVRFNSIFSYILILLILIALVQIEVSSRIQLSSFIN